MGNSISGCGYVTISEGDMYQMVEPSGKITLVEGPTQISTNFGIKLAKLTPVTASENQFVEIRFADGHTEFRAGPTRVFPHPVDHACVQLRELTHIHRGAALVVYAKDPGTSKVGRKILEGPCTYMPSSTTEWTKQAQVCIASDNEYISIKRLDGSVEYRRGPCSLVVDPELYATAEIKPGVQIGDQELIVVYRQKPEQQAVRHLVRGPQLYIPKNNMEWIHEFSWTANAEPNRDINAPVRKKIDGLKFTKLRTCPGKMYMDVENVRTKDNALLVAKLMIFFQYVDIEKMLDNTNDPFGEIINGVSADVVEFSVSKKFEEFLANTEHLNTLSAYPQLTSVVSKIGIAVDKVVFRGYQAQAALQKMHDSAIEQRTAMALKVEQEEEQQKITDLTLKREAQRVAQQHEVERSKAEHEIAMKTQIAENELKMKKAELELELERLRAIKDIDSSADIGKYLTAKEGTAPHVIQCGSLLTGSDLDRDKQ